MSLIKYLFWLYIFPNIRILSHITDRIVFFYAQLYKNSLYNLIMFLMFYKDSDERPCFRQHMSPYSIPPGQQDTDHIEGKRTTSRTSHL